MICEAFDVVAVPFPFVDARGAKRRPAVALTKRSFNQAGHSIFAMVTTRSHSPWPGDTPIQNLEVAGLHAPCLVRLKLFTLDNRLIVRKIGSLSRADRGSLAVRLKEILPA